ncbi:MAG: T9SS type A sorting domain-containing protein, partial [Bacteroidota bacterium]
VLSSNLGGTVAPGFSPGTISFDGNQVFQPSTVFEMDVDGIAVGEADLVDVDGSIDLSNINLEVAVSYTPTDGDEVTIITANSIIGSFATTDLPPGWSVIIDESVRLIYDAGALPVEVLFFMAVEVDQGVELAWATSAELNNEGFIVLHSVDGTNWRNIGFVNGNGNTSENSSYLFEHVDPSLGDNYYRLRQMDFDGQWSDSEIRIVQYGGLPEGFALTVYPNPSADFTYIDLPSQHLAGEVIVSNQAGQVVMRSVISENQSRLTLDLLPYAAGTYVITIELGQFRSSTRVIHSSY